MNTQYNSRLQEMALTTVTDFWNDSSSVQELTYAVERGAVGATSNPTIVLGVLKKEMYLWEDRIHQIIAENPSWSEVEITWKLIEEISANGARYLKPVYDREKGKKGRLSIQTNPAFYRNPEAIIQQAIHFNTLAPNMQVKAPVTRAGVKAVEEATFHGISINATVCFTVPQALAVAEAVERGLDRRVAGGGAIDEMSPVCTIMVGRLDDWMKVIIKRDGIDINPAFADWAGIAALKKAYGIYKKRGYRARLLGAAYRHLGHWCELIGGDLITTIPYEWQLKINASDIEVVERMQNPVDAEIVDALYQEIPDFRRAYDEDGMQVEEFDGFGATVRTLRTFISSCHDLISQVRDFMLPDPDIKK